MRFGTERQTGSPSLALSRMDCSALVDGKHLVARNLRLFGRQGEKMAHDEPTTSQEKDDKNNFSYPPGRPGVPRPCKLATSKIKMPFTTHGST